MRATWVHDPHSGGLSIPDAVKKRTEERIRVYAQQKYGGQFTSLSIRFRGALCYIDAFVEPPEPSLKYLEAFQETREEYLERLRATPLHLCRLRYFGEEDAWSVAFFTYSNEKYSPALFDNGTFYGTPEEAFEIGATYLGD